VYTHAFRLLSFAASPTHPLLSPLHTTPPQSIDIITKKQKKQGAAEEEEEEEEAAAAADEGSAADGREGEDALLYSAYVNPGFEVPAFITELTGISTAFLQQEGARPFEAVWPEFLAWLDGVRGGRPVVLVAHNAAFDHKHLVFDLRRCGWDAARAFRGEGGRHLIGMMDTLPVFRSDELWSRREGDGLPPKPSSFKQESLYRYLIGRALQDAHNARGDVMGLEALLSHPFVRRKWRGVGSASVLEMGGWVEGVDDVVAVADAGGGGSSSSSGSSGSSSSGSSSSDRPAPVVLEGSGGSGGGARPGGLAATLAPNGAGGSSSGGGNGGGGGGRGAGASKKGMMATRRRATEDGAACQ
jgi:DNA polymerase III epsilon subunit-like protein